MLLYLTTYVKLYRLWRIFKCELWIKIQEKWRFLSKFKSKTWAMLPTLCDTTRVFASCFSFLISNKLVVYMLKLQCQRISIWPVTIHHLMLVNPEFLSNMWFHTWSLISLNHFIIICWTDRYAPNVFAIDLHCRQICTVFTINIITFMPCTALWHSWMWSETTSQP